MENTVECFIANFGISSMDDEGDTEDNDSN
jgi:hypothetical protein